MKNPKAVGERSEGMVLAALLRAGNVVLQPFGDNQRYDLVVDEDGKFIRIQCKTARLVGGVLRFAACSSATRGLKKRDYRGQIEFFGVYSPDLDKTYLVPVSDVGTTEVTLRLGSAKNNQNKGVRYAETYEMR